MEDALASEDSETYIQFLLGGGVDPCPSPSPRVATSSPLKLQQEIRECNDALSLFTLFPEDAELPQDDVQKRVYPPVEGIQFITSISQ